MAFDFSPFAAGGAAARPDSFTGMHPQLAAALAMMVAEAPENIQSNFRITSGFRSPETQQRLWDDALLKYGSEEAARKWVAPPGRSQHNHGNAADLKYLDPSVQAYAHQNAAKYGLAFPLAHEPWHIELANARGRPDLAKNNRESYTDQQGGVWSRDQSGNFFKTGFATDQSAPGIGGLGAKPSPRFGFFGPKPVNLMPTTSITNQGGGGAFVARQGTPAASVSGSGALLPKSMNTKRWKTGYA